MRANMKPIKRLALSRSRQSYFWSMKVWNQSELRETRAKRKKRLANTFNGETSSNRNENREKLRGNRQSVTWCRNLWLVLLGRKSGEASEREEMEKRQNAKRKWSQSRRHLKLKHIMSGEDFLARGNKKANINAEQEEARKPSQAMWQIDWFISQRTTGKKTFLCGN